MGTWGTGPFDNDDAAAFEEQLMCDGRRAITAALRGTVAKQCRDESWCAATIVAAISERSGLADLWREAGELSAWRRSLTSLATRLAKPPASQAPHRPPARERKTSSRSVPMPRAAGAVPPIARRTAKQLLVKKTDGMLYDHLKSSVDVQLGKLKKLTRADAAALATLSDVRTIELSGMKLTPDKQAVLETLLEGWSHATGLDVSDSERVARVGCAFAHRMSRLTSLDLSDSDVTDADLRALAGHPAAVDCQREDARRHAGPRDRTPHPPRKIADRERTNR